MRIHLDFFEFIPQKIPSLQPAMEQLGPRKKFDKVLNCFNFFDNVDYRQQMIWPIGSYSTIIYIVVCSERVEPYYLSQSRDK